MQESNSLFSVILICYNNQEYLPVSIGSVLEQNYKNIELIIADDFSTNFNVNEWDDYVRKHNNGNIKNIIIYQNEKNIGTVKNINNALKKVTGNYVKILAADDALYNNMTLENAKIALDKSKFGIIAGNVYKYDSNSFVEIGKYSNDFIENYNKYNSIKCFKNECIRNKVIAGSVFFNNYFFSKYGLFDEDCLLIEDWSKWLQVYLEGGIIEYYNFDALKYRFDAGVGRSINKIYINDKKIIFRKYVKNNKRKIGVLNYLKALFTFKIRTSVFLRKIYNFIFR